MKTHRIDESGFLDTKTPEEHFQDSTRGMLDSEFSCDAPREGMGIAGALILVVLGLLLGSVFYGVVSGINWIVGVFE